MAVEVCWLKKNARGKQAATELSRAFTLRQTRSEKSTRARAASAQRLCSSQNSALRAAILEFPAASEMPELSPSGGVHWAYGSRRKVSFVEWKPRGNQTKMWDSPILPQNTHNYPVSSDETDLGFWPWQLRRRTDSSQGLEADVKPRLGA